jgi:hypothetical protein
MTIKPMDFQVMIPKTSEVSKIHNDAHHKNNMVQQQQVSSIQQSADHQMKQVYSQQHAQEGRIREKQEKNREQKKNEKKKKAGYDSKKRSTEPTVQTSTIDIRL